MPDGQIGLLSTDFREFRNDFGASSDRARGTVQRLGLAVCRWGTRHGVKILPTEHDRSQQLKQLTVSSATARPSPSVGRAWSAARLVSASVLCSAAAAIGATSVAVTRRRLALAIQQQYRRTTPNSRFEIDRLHDRGHGAQCVRPFLGVDRARHDGHRDRWPQSDRPAGRAGIHRRRAAASSDPAARDRERRAPGAAPCAAGGAPRGHLPPPPDGSPGSRATSRACRESRYRLRQSAHFRQADAWRFDHFNRCAVSEIPQPGAAIAVGVALRVADQMDVRMDQ